MPKKRSILPVWLSWALGFAFVVSGLTVSSLAYLTATAYWERPFNPLEAETAAGREMTLPSIDNGGGEARPAPAVVQATQTAAAQAAAEAVTPSERITILMMGIDRRPGEAFISRTDTMMLLSINPISRTASILSIPRDLYVQIPGRGRDRINTAFVYGSGNGGPAEGAGLAMETMELNLGVPIDYYLLIDFNAFIQSVDAVGGIDVYVPVTINDPTYPDMNYGYDPLYIPAGQHHFNGVTALKYARTRHQDNDFGRAARQQQVVMAMREKIFSLGIDELLRQLPFLYQQLSDGIRTDLSRKDMVSLASAAGEIPAENIKTAVLDTTYVSSYTTPQGASVLIPQNERVAPLIQEMFID